MPVGAYLSGGMDSGAITALAARELPYLNTFTGGFDLSSRLGHRARASTSAPKAEAHVLPIPTEHYEVVLKAGDMERCMPALVWHLEDPRVGQCYPNFYVARLASKFVKVVLSGTGGDELFGGYPWRYYRAVVNDDFEHYVDEVLRLLAAARPGDRSATVPARVLERRRRPRTLDIFRDVFPGSDRAPRAPEDYINHSLYLEAKTFLHGLLVVEDKLSMAHGLETRVPVPRQRPRRLRPGAAGGPEAPRPRRRRAPR